MWDSQENYKSESVKLKHNQIIFPDQELWQIIWSAPWALMAGVLSVTVLVRRHVLEITDPQESRDNKQMKGLGGAELTLNSILLNLSKKNSESRSQLIAHAGKCAILYINLINASRAIGQISGYCSEHCSSARHCTDVSTRSCASANLLWSFLPNAWD